MGKSYKRQLTSILFYFSQDDRVCVSDQVIEISNVKYRTSGTGNGLFCIYTDNCKWCSCLFVFNKKFWNRSRMILNEMKNSKMKWNEKKC